jgi:hypothetical protein
MNEKRAKHCMVIVEDPADAYNKLILAIGGVSVSYHRDPYLKETKQKVFDLSSVEAFSISNGKWQRYNAKL